MNDECPLTVDNFSSFLRPSGLFIALYFPDLFIISDVKSSTGLDIILTFVLLVFVFEWVALSLLDMSYLFGFFWFMDMVGSKWRTLIGNTQ